MKENRESGRERGNTKENEVEEAERGNRRTLEYCGTNSICLGKYIQMADTNHKKATNTFSFRHLTYILEQRSVSRSLPPSVDNFLHWITHVLQILLHCIKKKMISNNKRCSKPSKFPHPLNQRRGG